MSAGSHIADELLERYAMRAASEEECAPLEEHLLSCEECRERLERWDRYVRAMRAAAGELRRTPEFMEWLARVFGGQRLVWALGFTLVLLLLVGIHRSWLRMGGPPPLPVALIATRGAADSPLSVPAGRALALTLDAAGLPAYPAYGVEVVDPRGRRVFESAADRRDGRVGMSLPARTAGLYFVRLLAPDKTLLREFSLPVAAR
jgi:anti-sigma factor RsiW